ncbi:hypothetical protein [Salinarchaeum laminariae]|uniref:hypothetical protein n=1 Tax=Salinarchaeum laminariae TaxID=869888 RepID=UPI0020C07189|nr:hypothetical protein [Salinarchaeum laminariae]
MTDDPLSDVSVADSDEFESALGALLEQAVAARVDVRGAWEFQTNGTRTDWEVEIVELARELNEE